MSRVSRISRVRVPGVLRAFNWPDDLADFGRCNLIYGWNGTGKTTLSRVFRALESRQPPSSGNAVVRIDGAELNSADFGTATLPVRVFNKDFINETVFPTGGGEVPPILVVGSESVAKQRRVDELKSERHAAEQQLVSAREVRQEAENSLDRFCIGRARAIKDMLRSSGVNSYNNYDKAAFRTRSEQMLENDDASTHRLSDAGRDGLLAQHRSSMKPTLSLVNYRIPTLQRIADEVSELLSATVVSSAIEALKNDQPLSEWIRTGLGLHEARTAKHCLFCEQSLEKTRMSTLEAHFSAEYENVLTRLDDKLNELRVLSEQTDEPKPPSRPALYDDLASEYETALQSFERTLETIRQFVDAIVASLTEKKGRVFDRLAMDVSVPSVDAMVADNLNAVIRSHNRACDEFPSRLSAARDRLALDMIAGCLDEFVTLKRDISDNNAAISPLDQEVKRHTGEIKRLEREIVEHRQPAEELNEDLQGYLGHGELKLQIRDTGYTITRNDFPAQTLSEGETTAIALLYFLKSLKDRRFELDNGVVVLDDPVSSLDGNALYLAFGFIRERTKDADQLFIFTHNFTFFRQVRNWFHHLKGQNKKNASQRPARFYMLNCVEGDGERCSAIGPLDPLLEQYESEYHYLFARVYREACAESTSSLENNYVLPNMARRVLESFLAFRQPHVSGELGQKLNDVTFDEAKKYRILRFVHTYSHGDAIGDPEHDPSNLGEARSVLKDLMELIEAQDADHFRAMKALVMPPEDEVVEA
jgi:wobble nucleotide-excising tRNase